MISQPQNNETENECTIIMKLMLYNYLLKVRNKSCKNKLFLDNFIGFIGFEYLYITALNGKI